MPALADPLPLKGLRLRNRLVMPAITTAYATSDGRVTDQVVRFYAQRARHVALVVVEATAVRRDGRIAPASLGLWEDAHAAGLHRVASAIQGQGAVATIQLNHAGARAFPLAGEAVGASPSGVRLRPEIAPFALAEPGLAALAEDFGTAARRAVQAGFDGVEVHGAHLYLLGQFLSPLTNLRRDRYGGDALGRAAFPLEVVRAVRDRIGAAPLLLFRLNGEERIPGGQTPADAGVVAAALVRAGVDVVDVSIAAQTAWREDARGRFLETSSALPETEAPGAAVSLAVAVRRACAAPVIAVGKLGCGRASAAALDAGADLVAVGRQLVADPEAAGKLLDGRDGELVPCRECTACLGAISRGLPLTCAVNPDLVGPPERRRGRDLGAQEEPA